MILARLPQEPVQLRGSRSHKSGWHLDVDASRSDSRSSHSLACPERSRRVTLLPPQTSRNSSLINSLRTLAKTTEGCLPARADLSRPGFSSFDANSFRIRSYEKSARKSFRIRSYKNHPGVGCPYPQPLCSQSDAIARCHPYAASESGGLSQAGLTLRPSGRSDV